IADNLLDKKREALILARRTSDALLRLESDRAARILRALLAEIYLLRREITESHDPQWTHRGTAGWWVRCTCDAAVPVGRHGDAEPDI
ncbi:hypothetical protein, partial [Francisella tularensis]|uniref:hypothetical protein n=1 Tax=Francisella tularensis TaxID=263 RepID=UPI002381A277